MAMKNLIGILLLACCGHQHVQGQTSVDFGFDAGKGKDPSVSAGVNHKGKNWSAGVKGTTDFKGNWGVGLSATLRFRKRSVDWNGEHFTVTLHADPCEFSLYDINRDGVIVKSELYAVFGDKVKSEELFSALDITTGDGHIDEEEFYFMSHVYINGCESANKERQTKYM